MDIDVKTVETRTVTVTLTEKEAEHLMALTVFFPYTGKGDNEYYTKLQSDFKGQLYRAIKENLGKVTLDRDDYIKSV